jgi:hypothetical protein
LSCTCVGMVLRKSLKQWRLIHASNWVINLEYIWCTRFTGCERQCIYTHLSSQMGNAVLLM